MPCNCDHMKPMEHEFENRMAARLVVMLSMLEGTHVPPEKAVRAAASFYGYGGDEFVPVLCALVMQNPHIVATVENECARVVNDLKAWVERHEEYDRRRKETEEAIERAKKSTMFVRWGDWGNAAMRQETTR